MHGGNLEFLLGQIHLSDTLTQILERHKQYTKDLIRLVIHRDCLKIGILMSCGHLLIQEIDTGSEFIVVLGEKVVKNDPNTLAIDRPDLLILVHIGVQSQHIEEDIDGEDRVAKGMEETGLLLLSLNLVSFKHGLLHVNEVEGLLVFALLCQDLQVKFDKLLIHGEVWLLHQLKEKQVCDIEDLGLKPQTETDEIHGLNCPLGVNILLVDLVEVQTLILLLQKLVFSNVCEEELLS